MVYAWLEDESLVADDLVADDLVTDDLLLPLMLPARVTLPVCCVFPRRS